MNVNALLLAAGFSKRMRKFKPLLNFEDEPIIVAILRKLSVLVNKIFIVTGYNERKITRTVNESLHDFVLNGKIIFVNNPDYEKEMFSSLKVGLKAAKNSDWLLYHFVDQPQLTMQFYDELLAQIDDESDLIQPSYNNLCGHPILIKKSIFDNILLEKDNSSLREVFNNLQIKKNIWQCNYNAILKDLDTPADYKKLAEGLHEYL